MAFKVLFCFYLYRNIFFTYDYALGFVSLFDNSRNSVLTDFFNVFTDKSRAEIFGKMAAKYVLFGSLFYKNKVARILGYVKVR